MSTVFFILLVFGCSNHTRENVSCRMVENQELLGFAINVYKSFVDSGSKPEYVFLPWEEVSNSSDIAKMRLELSKDFRKKINPQKNFVLAVSIESKQGDIERYLVGMDLDSARVIKKTYTSSDSYDGYIKISVQESSSEYSIFLGGVLWENYNRSRKIIGGLEGV